MRAVRRSLSKSSVRHAVRWRGLACLSFCVSVFATSATMAQPKQVIAYVFPKNELLVPSRIPVESLTRINYAFANVQDGKVVEGATVDAANLHMLAALKRDHPTLQVLVSVGGWAWSGNFSDAARTPESRRKFVDSAYAFLSRYGIDGLDIDWEYPGMVGAGNVFRPEDGANFIQLLADLRERFDREERTTHHRLLLSIAAGASDEFLSHTDMGKAQRSLDTINLMAYDFYVPGQQPTTGNHAPLYTDPRDPAAVSADNSVRAFERAGVPARKLVLGVPFYGHRWTDVGAANHGLFQKGSASPPSYVGYADIIDKQQSSGFQRYWDEAAAAPSLYNAKTHEFISYEDPESLARKCAYVTDNGLAGVMFWELFSDPSGALLQTIHGSLK